jgi:MOSC domain-containing protein YiiM
MGEPMVEHHEIRALAGIGLEGDRYAQKMGAYSEARIGKPGRIRDEDRQVSLISTGGLQVANALLAEKGVDSFSFADTRRGLVVEATAEQLIDLVGKRFRVCNVVMEGVEDCTPCKRPALLAGRKVDGGAFEAAFSEGRGGLRARVINDGVISIKR